MTLPACFPLCFLVGVLGGVVSGLVGVGGGIVIVPLLLFLFGMNQHQAQGTSLAVLLLPVGLLAVWTYYRQGYIDLRMVPVIALGFLLGGWGGGTLAAHLSHNVLQRVFGVLLLAVGAKLTFFK